jgi:acetyl-CoA carboxylase biotin carboxyl carrier protein
MEIVKLLREVVRQLKRDPSIITIEISQGNWRCKVSRQVQASEANQSTAEHSNSNQTSIASPEQTSIQTKTVDQKPSNLIELKSPMVGTFYRASSPDAAPYVKVGDEIAPDQTLGIVEAMKLMNEISALVSKLSFKKARVHEIRAENAQPVQFDQTLFVLEVLES